ncbi:MAG: hypothetical protein K9L88_11355, partial [Chromatiaceae bacterium]|nr:hypothetical protein [Chromatiaceae bacterium]
MPATTDLSIRPTLWTDSATPVGVSLDQLLYRIRQSDTDGLIFDAVTLEDFLEGAEPIILDALTTTQAKLQRQVRVIERVLKTAGQTLNVVSSQISDPYKRQGVINVAVIFELSDGQTLSILFHNPDAANVKSLKAGDALISWKWLLNKRDITIVVAPEKGVEQPVRQIAQRVMKLAEKNSAAFARINRQRAERMERIDGLRTEIAGLEKTLDGLKSEIEVAKVEKEERDMELAQRPSRALSALERIKGFLGLSQYRSMVEALSARETAPSEADKALALAELIDTMATRMQQDSKGTEATAYLRYQQGSAEHYITEKDDSGDGTEGARGWIEAIKAIGDVNIRNLVNGGATLDTGFQPAVLSGVVDVSEPEPEIEPTTAEGYAKLLEQGDEALARYQDPLDSTFQQRLVDVRNALRASGWEDGPGASQMTRGGVTMTPFFRHAGGGNNVVGVQYDVVIRDQSRTSYVDDFSQSPSALASQIDAAVPVVEPGPEPEPLGSGTPIHMGGWQVSALETELEDIDESDTDLLTLRNHWNGKDLYQPKTAEEAEAMARAATQIANTADEQAEQLKKAGDKEAAKMERQVSSGATALATRLWKLSEALKKTEPEPEQNNNDALDVIARNVDSAPLSKAIKNKAMRYLRGNETSLNIEGISKKSQDAIFESIKAAYLAAIREIAPEQAKTLPNGVYFGDDSNRVEFEVAKVSGEYKLFFGEL